MQIIDPSFPFLSLSPSLVLILISAAFLLFYFFSFQPQKKNFVMKMMTMREEHRFHEPLNATAADLILNYGITVFDDEI